MSQAARARTGRSCSACEPFTLCCSENVSSASPCSSVFRLFQLTTYGLCQVPFLKNHSRQLAPQVKVGPRQFYSVGSGHLGFSIDAKLTIRFYEHTMPHKSLGSGRPA